MIKITDHKEQAISRLLAQYSDKDNFKSVIEGIAEMVQDSEDDFYPVLELLDINNATGLWLDLLGSILGQKRLGLGDAIYRSLIYSKIGRNTSNGTYANIVSVFIALTESTSITFKELDYASISLLGNSLPDPTVQDLLKEYMQAVVLAGVKVSEIGYQYDNPFIIASLTVLNPDGGGFSSLASPTSGGQLGTLFA